LVRVNRSLNPITYPRSDSRLRPHRLQERYPITPSGSDALAIIASFCLVTLYGSGVASLARFILDRRISELREGMEIDGARITKITIEGNLLKPRN
jgi:hypothetical protein